MKNFIARMIGAIKEAPRKLLNLALDWFERPIKGIYHGFKHVERVLTEGNYHYDKKSALGELLSSKMPDLPDTLPAVAADRMVKIIKAVGKKLAWVPVLAIFVQSPVTFLWGFGLVTAAGAGLMVREYVRARNRMNDAMREVNVAGQTVEGARKDLCRLYNAQARIFKIADNLRSSTLESTTETIGEIVASVADESKRVTVLEGGRYGAGMDHYEFSEICIKLVEDEAAAPARLRQAWAGKASNDNKLEERIRQLEAVVEGMKTQAGNNAPKP